MAIAPESKLSVSKDIIAHTTRRSIDQMVAERYQLGIPLTDTYSVYKVGNRYHAVNEKAGSTVKTSEDVGALITTIATDGYKSIRMQVDGEETWDVDTSIVLYPYTMLTGCGYNSPILKITDGANCSAITGSTAPTAAARLGIRLGNFSIDGNIDNQTGDSYGLYFTSYRNCLAEFIRIDDCYTDGVYLKGATEATWTFQWVMRFIMSYGNGGHGFNLEGSNHEGHYCFGNTNTGSGFNLGELVDSKFHNCQAETNGVYGWNGVLVQRCTLMGCNGWDNTKDGLMLYGALYNKVISGIWGGNTESGIEISSSGSVIASGNIISLAQFSTNTRYGIEETNVGAGVPSLNIITDNQFYTNTLGDMLRISTTDIVRNNQGYVTENCGSSTGTGAQQTIAHGLSFTPTAQQIALTPGSATAVPFHSAAPDATNIYVTATSGQAWYWSTTGS